MTLRPVAALVLAVETALVVQLVLGAGTKTGSKAEAVTRARARAETGVMPAPAPELEPAAGPAVLQVTPSQPYPPQYPPAFC